MLLGGFPYVIEAVGGLESVTESIRLVDYWGTVLFIGTGGAGEVDLSALWFKEAELVGAWNHSHGVHPARGAHHSIDLALEVLAAGGLPDSVVTHAFALEDLREAVATAIDKRNSHADQSRVPPRRAELVGLAVAVADARAFHELGERHVLEHAAALLVDADPHLLEDAVAFAVVGMVRHRELRAFDRGDDVGERDVLGRVREHVAAADAALRPHEARRPSPTAGSARDTAAAATCAPRSP